MTRRRLFYTLANITGFIGIGMLLGYGMSDRLHKTAFWLGCLLVLIGALLTGMYISARGEKAPKPAANDRPLTPLGNGTEPKNT